MSRCAAIIYPDTVAGMTNESNPYPEREPVELATSAAEELAEARTEMGWEEGEPKIYRTKDGRVLTDADFDVMADEVATDEWAEKLVEAIRQREIAAGMPPDMWLGDWLAASRVTADPSRREKLPEEWLAGLDGPAVVIEGPLTHPDNPRYHEDVERLASERMVEHLRTFPPEVRREAIRRFEELAVKLRRDRERDRWLVTVDGEVLGEVYKARVHTDRYQSHSPSDRYRGRTRWFAGNVNDEDFDTRRDAVAEVLRRR
jgi:hypothetical protein